MSDYNAAWKALNSVSGGQPIEDSLEALTVDQKIKVAEVIALISISQELSALNPQNTTTYDDDGAKRNGWGFPA